MQIERKGDVIVVTIPCTDAHIKNAAPSSSGKTLLVDTGNAKVPTAMGPLTVQVSAYVPNPAFKAEPKAKAAKAA